MAPAELTPQQQAWIEAATPRVEQIARTLARQTGAPRDDLRSAGFEGLLQAVHRYDPACGVPFVPYAHRRIRGAMIDDLRRQGRSVRQRARAVRTLEASQAVLEQAEKAEPSPEVSDPRTLQERVRAAAEIVARTTAAVVLSRVVALEPDRVHSEHLSAERIYLQGETVRTVREELDASPAEDRALLTALYVDGLSMSAYAERQGMSKSTISRLHAKALGRFAARVRRRLGG